MSIFCKHKWIVLSTHKLPSILEESIRLGKLMKCNHAEDAIRIAQITVVETLQCTECGKLVSNTYKN